jgi:hypothetical protein
VYTGMEILNEKIYAYVITCVHMSHIFIDLEVSNSGQPG